MALDDDLSVIDPFGGRDDLERRLIRAVGDPMLRFSEDALRILRGVRLAAQLGFELEETTAAAMEACAPLTERVSAERIKTEVEKILLSPRPQWVRKLMELGVLNRFWTGWRPCNWDRLEETEATPKGRWRAFCDLTGFPISALPVERTVRMAVLYPERETVKILALSGMELYALGLRGKEIGSVQRRLALHVLKHPEDNTPERLCQLLDDGNGM